MSGAPVTARRELDPDTLAALEEQRDYLLASLRDLEREREAGDVEEDDYEALKDDYTARAANVIRAIESRQAKITANRRRRSPLALGLTALGVVVFAVLVGVAVMQASGTRGQGDTATGDLRMTTRQMLLDAQSRWQTDPQGALELYEEVLDADPSNVEAMAYRGWFLNFVATQATGADRDDLLASALVYLDEAVATDPEYPDARVFRASVRLSLGDPEGAAADLDALDPSGLTREFQSLVEPLRDRVDEALAAGQLLSD